LQPVGKQAKIGEGEGTILQLLKEANGTLSFTYKSDAEDIKKAFGMSKKNFKRTLTELIESKQIELLEDSIRLL
jgi:predicted RNA-binding protein (virulence factor B family)